MQGPLTLQKKLFPIKTIATCGGSKVPFEVAGYQRDYELAQAGGFFDLSDWGVVEVSGPDAQDYLQRMSTVNMKSLEVGQGAAGAFLTGKGTVVALGSFFKKEDGVYWFIIPPYQREKALAHLEQFHFQERLEIRDVSDSYALLGLWKASQESGKWTWKDTWRSPLFWKLVERTQLESLLESWKERAFPLLGMHLFHFFRVQAGVPWMGWEIGEGDLVLEASLEAAVARNKGCYPGQELVERIFTYGQVNKKLLRVELFLDDNSELLEADQEILKEGNSIGRLKSVVAHPGKKGMALGLAFVKKGFWDSPEEYQVNSAMRLKIMSSENLEECNA